MNISLFIILGVVLVIAGFLLALLVIPLLGLDDRSTKPLVSRKKVTEPSIIPSQPPVAARSLRVWRDPQNNTFYVEIDSQVYNTVTGLNPDQRRFLSAITTELVAWMSQAVVEPDMRVSVEPSVRPASSTGLPPAEPKPTSSDHNVVNAFLRTLQPASSKTHQPPKSLAAQIDEILQEKMALSGFIQHTVHLSDLPNYGMSVQVDREQYENIDSVPDEEIRRLIREAVEEWQRRNSLKRM